MGARAGSRSDSIPGSVMIPDLFRLVHPDGRTFLLEIVGYWRPEYLKRNFLASGKPSGSRLSDFRTIEFRESWCQLC